MLYLLDILDILQLMQCAPLFDGQFRLGIDHKVRYVLLDPEILGHKRGYEAHIRTRIAFPDLGNDFLPVLVEVALESLQVVTSQFVL